MKKIKKILKKIIRHLKVIVGYFTLIPKLFNKKNPKILIILGMHRSGTSCITKIFNLTGIDLGKNLLQPQRDNPQGFWEDWYLVQINQQILKNSNGSWDKPPSEIHVSLKNKLDILSFIYNNRSKSKVFGFKDPRILLTWDAWKPYFKNHVIVGVFRHPTSVSKSLYTRNQINEKFGNKLWYEYNSKLLEINKSENITFINFDNYLTFEDKIKKIVSIVGLNYNSEALNFYDNSNRNSDCIEEIINKKNKNIYNQLLKEEDK